MGRPKSARVGERRESVRKLREQGFAFSEIAGQLSVSKSTIAADIKALAEIGPSDPGDVPESLPVPVSVGPVDWETISSEAVAALRGATSQGNVSAARMLATLSLPAVEERRAGYCNAQHVDAHKVRDLLLEMFGIVSRELKGSLTEALGRVGGVAPESLSKIIESSMMSLSATFQAKVDTTDLR